jgi:cyclopropane fatty-acyl-phospholipid synthase-like methyltransferase
MFLVTIPNEKGRMTDRKTHWENVFTSKSPLAVSWYQKEPTLSLKLIGAARLQKYAPLIDVGGGASALVDGLVNAAYTSVSVLDVSASAMQHARDRLAGRAVGVTWIEADVTRFDPPQQYRLWHDRAVFHFLTDADDRKRYVATLKKALSPGGRVVMQTFAVGGPQKCSGLDIVQYDARKLLGELGEDFDLLESGREVHTTPMGARQKFAWFQLDYKPA